MKKCLVCKAEISNDNAEFCKRCGAKLSPSVSQTKEKMRTLSGRPMGTYRYQESKRCPVVILVEE